MLITQKLCGELGLGLVHAGAGAAIDWMYLHDHQHIGARYKSKTERHYQQQQSHHNAPGMAVELDDGRYESAVAKLLESDGLHHRVDRLEEVNEEEHHKVETRIVAKCLISGPKPKRTS